VTQTVVVVGAGPVGLMLGYELGLLGVETVVVERLPEPRHDSPGVAINSGVVELFSQRRVMDLLEDDGFGFPQAHFAYLPLDPTKLTDPHPFTFTMVQQTLERRVGDAAAKLGVRIRRGEEVVGLTQDDSGVTVTLRGAAGETTLRCRYLVGCDGADSTVRRLAGIDFPGEDFPFYGITGDLEVRPGDELVDLMGAGFQAKGAFTLAPTGPEILALVDPDDEDAPEGPVVVRVLAGEFGVAPPDPDAPATVDELHAMARRILGRDVAIGPVRWLSRWDHRSRQADKYRVGNVFLAGDAAHVHFPLGGQALSTGLEDAVNLGWKLAAQVHGWAPADLLDSYHSERHPVAARALRTILAQVQLVYPMEQVSAVRAMVGELIGIPAVNDHLVRVAGGLDVRYPIGDPETHRLLGKRIPDFPLRTAAGSTSVAPLLHDARGVLLVLGGAAPDLTGWADRIDTVSAEPSAAIDAAALLLRPDGRVAWITRDPDVATAGPAAADLAAALATWFGPARPA